MDVNKIKLKIIKAGEKAVNELIKVAGEDIIKYGEDDELAADNASLFQSKLSAAEEECSK